MLYDYLGRSIAQTKRFGFAARATEYALTPSERSAGTPDAIASTHDVPELTEDELAEEIEIDGNLTGSRKPDIQVDRRARPRRNAIG